MCTFYFIIFQLGTNIIPSSLGKILKRVWFWELPNTASSVAALYFPFCYGPTTILQNCKNNTKKTQKQEPGLFASLLTKNTGRNDGTRFFLFASREKEEFCSRRNLEFCLKPCVNFGRTFGKLHLWILRWSIDLFFFVLFFTCQRNMDTPLNAIPYPLTPSWMLGGWVSPGGSWGGRPILKRGRGLLDCVTCFWW